jgi:hypothetical protein
VIADFRDFSMTCPFGLDTIRISQRLHDDCDCHHPSVTGGRPVQRKAPRCGGASLAAQQCLPVS